MPLPGSSSGCIIIEDGNSFVENAMKKAKEVFEYTGITSLADDSGLEVDYLNGEPGIYSARFAGEHGDTKANNQKLLKLMENVPEKDRGAQFHCALAIVGKDIKYRAFIFTSVRCLEKWS